MFGSADEAIARVRSDVARARERAQRMSELRERTAEVRGSAVSRQRDLAVEVDSSGAVLDLQVSDAALERGGPGLSAELLALIAAARADAQRRLLEVAGEVLGPDDPLVDTLAASSPPQTPPSSGEHGVRW